MELLFHKAHQEGSANASGWAGCFSLSPKPLQKSWKMADNSSASIRFGPPAGKR